MSTIGLFFFGSSDDDIRNVGVVVPLEIFISVLSCLFG